MHQSWVNADTGADDLWWAGWDEARDQTPLPSSGIAWWGYPTGAALIDVERNASRDH